jgi:hypothetical protein
MAYTLPQSAAADPDRNPVSEPVDNGEFPSVGAGGQVAATGVRAEPIQLPIYWRSSLGAVPESDQFNAH